MSLQFYPRKEVNKLYDFTSEIYYRAAQFVKRELTRLEQTQKYSGRRLPGVVRKSEKLRYPSQLSAFQSISYFTSLIIVNYDNDLASSEILQIQLNQARRYGYQGKWRFYLELVQYFGLEDETTNLKYRDNPDSLFDLPEYFYFLSLYFTEDEIFGNILKSGTQLLFKTWKIENRWKADLRKIKKPQRKRGYTDKGNLPNMNDVYLRKANIELTYQVAPKYDPTSEIVLFGPPLSKEEIEEINYRLLLSDEMGGV